MLFPKSKKLQFHTNPHLEIKLPLTNPVVSLTQQVKCPLASEAGAVPPGRARRAPREPGSRAGRHSAGCAGAEVREDAGQGASGARDSPRQTPLTGGLYVAASRSTAASAGAGAGARGGGAGSETAAARPRVPRPRRRCQGDRRRKFPRWPRPSANRTALAGARLPLFRSHFWPRAGAAPLR